MLERLEKTATTWDDTTDIDAALDKRITRKFDRHVVPWLFGLWLLAFIDRANVGNARIDGLADELGLDGYKFNIALAVFYIPYICVDVPSNLVLKHLRAGIYLPSLVVVWGLVSTCTGFVKTYEGLLACRFFLGLAEGGLLGGLVLYLSMFYRRHQLLYRIVMFYAAAPLSGAVGGLLATGLAEIKSGSYNGWPFIFFVEGAITIIFGVTACFFLPHTPGEAKFLSEEERAGAVARMRLDAHGATTATDVNEEKFSWYYFRRAFLNINTLMLSLNFFAIITPIYSFSLFLPSIISSLGYTRVTAQLLTVPPNAGAVATVILTGWFSDKIRMRGPLMLVGVTVAIAGYIMLISTDYHLVNYGGTFLVAAGVFPCSPLVMGWLANNLAPHYVRATGTGAQIMFGTHPHLSRSFAQIVTDQAADNILAANLAAFVSTFTYIQRDA